MTTTTTTAVVTDRSQSTRRVLTAGVAAGPFFVATVVAQGLFRDGFDFSRHPASLLSNGDLGWIQIANFLITGLLTITAAAGLRQALAGGRGATWAPRLVRIFGAGTIASAVFVLDAGDGFPAGTPAGPGTMSWHGAAHLVVSSIAFVALMATTLVLARRFSGLGQTGRAVASVFVGVVFLAANVTGSVFGADHPRLGVIGFDAGVLVVLAWFTWTMHHLRSQLD